MVGNSFKFLFSKLFVSFSPIIGVVIKRKKLSSKKSLLA